MFANPRSWLLIDIIVIEAIILCLIIISMITGRIISYFKAKRELLIRKKISKIFISHLESNKPFKIAPPHKEMNAFYPLLSIIEEFNLRFNESDWKDLKEVVAKHYLLPKARKWSTSRFWTRRNAAARCFAAVPLEEDKRFIFRLIDDPIFLTRKPAIEAATALELESGTLKILHHMSVEKGYPHLFYRDALLQGSKKVFTWIEETASHTKNIALHLACLDLLASKSLVITKPFLKRDLHSHNPKLRLGAIKVFARNPQRESAGHLFEAIDDPDADVRVQAAFGMQYFGTQKILLKLKHALNDESIAVQLQAAHSLKLIGEDGIAILKDLDPLKNKRRYEIAQYVLKFL